MKNKITLPKDDDTTLFSAMYKKHRLEIDHWKEAYADLMELFLEQKTMYEYGKTNEFKQLKKDKKK